MGSHLRGRAFGLTALLFVAGACASPAAAPGQSTVPDQTATLAPSSVPTQAQPTADAVELLSCPAEAIAWDGKTAVDLTGVWAGDDRGIFYIRQAGDVVWWAELSGLGGPVARVGGNFTNVYNGHIKGSTVTGMYADVPRGRTMLQGPVVMEVTRTASGDLSLVRTTPDAQTPFGGKVLTPCAPG